MALTVTGKVANPVRLSGNISVAFVTFTPSGNYTTGGEDITADLKASIPGYNSTSNPVFACGTTNTGYTVMVDALGYMSLWDGKTEMANGAPYDAASVDVMLFFEKF